MINTPLVEGATIHLADGKDFTISTTGFSPMNKFIVGAELNGTPYPYSSIRHKDIAAGGTLVLQLGDKPGEWGREFAPESAPVHYKAETVPTDLKISANQEFNPNDLLFVFKLHGQTRRYKMSFDPLSDGAIRITWGIERNLKWQEGTYTMTPEAVSAADYLDLSMPIDGAHVTLPSNATAYIISRKAYNDLKEKESMTYNNAVFRVLDTTDGIIHVIDDSEGCEMWILDNPALPVIWAMLNNPLEVNWTVK